MNPSPQSPLPELVGVLEAVTAAMRQAAEAADAELLLSLMDRRQEVLDALEGVEAVDSATYARLIDLRDQEDEILGLMALRRDELGRELVRMHHARHAGKAYRQAA
ncbi:MAG: flagellar protein FliT [Fimbriimonadaceae bacterium]|nr:flagellar protein FliT [Fimbriimonadaceae bacterium]